MMERSSFFNAELKGEEYDRVYLAEDYARYFASFIGNGVFPTPSTNLQVVSDGTTMNLALKQGKAWINGYFYENTEDLELSVDVADGVLNRIDKVVLRLDFVNREIKAYVKKGEFSSSPVAPTLQRDSDMYELGIADIRINKGVTKLVQADITDLRQNSNYCGLVAGVVQQIDTTNLFAQFQSTFDIWFEHIKGKLSTDQAGNLQNQIDLINSNKIDYTDIINDLITGGTEKVLSAEQGKVIAALLSDNVKQINEFEENKANKEKDTIGGITLDGGVLNLLEKLYLRGGTTATGLFIDSNGKGFYPDGSDSWDLGKSTNSWRSLFIDRLVKIGNQLEITNNGIATTTLDKFVISAVNAVASRWVSLILQSTGTNIGELKPEIGHSVSLGASDRRFSNIYLVNSPNVSSFRELKDNIKIFDDRIAYDNIKNLPIYTYNFKKIDEDGNQIGIDAENMLGSIYDELPIECINETAEGVDLYAYTSYAISALKIAINKIECLEKEIELLKTE